MGCRLQVQKSVKDVSRWSVVADAAVRAVWQGLVAGCTNRRTGTLLRVVRVKGLNHGRQQRLSDSVCKVMNRIRIKT